MNREKISRILTIGNLTIVIYFVLLWIVNYFKVDFVWIGVFRDLLTIPFLLAQLFFLVFGVIYFLKNKLNTLNFISLLVLAICSTLTIGSFF